MFGGFMQWFAIRLSIPRSARNSKITHAQITSMVKLDFFDFILFQMNAFGDGFC